MEWLFSFVGFIASICTIFGVSVAAIVSRGNKKASTQTKAFPDQQPNILSKSEWIKIFYQGLVDTAVVTREKLPIYADVPVTSEVGELFLLMMTYIVLVLIAGICLGLVIAGVLYTFVSGFQNWNALNVGVAIGFAIVGILVAIIFALIFVVQVEEILKKRYNQNNDQDSLTQQEAIQ